MSTLIKNSHLFSNEIKLTTSPAFNVIQISFPSLLPMAPLSVGRSSHLDHRLFRCDFPYFEFLLSFKSLEYLLSLCGTHFTMLSFVK